MQVKFLSMTFFLRWRIKFIEIFGRDEKRKGFVHKLWHTTNHKRGEKGHGYKKEFIVRPLNGQCKIRV